MNTMQGSKMAAPIFIDRWTPKILFSLKEQASSTRGVAPLPRKRLAAHAYQNASQARRIKRPARKRRANKEEGLQNEKGSKQGTNCLSILRAHGDCAK